MAKKAKVVNSGDLLERLNGTSSNKMSAMLAESIFFNEKDTIRTRVPIINLMMSGRLDGGITPGLTCIAGPSKHFKSNLSLVMVSAYLRKYPKAVCLFFDNEFGSTPDYFTSQGVDISRVVHCPFIDVEELKFDIVKKLESITRGDKVIIYIDSIGNVASKKELQDAKDEKSAQDMTRAKQIKSLFRMVTPYLTVLDIPCIAVNHTYETQEMFSKTVMSGGTGPMYSADTVIILGKQQDKDGKELLGYNFVMNAEKSRAIKEKSKLDLMVSFEGGINTYSGLLKIAQELGFVTKPQNARYQRNFLDLEPGEMVIPEDEKKWTEEESDSLEFWKPMFSHKPFMDAVSNAYKLKAVEVSQEVFDEVDQLFG
ncbi:UvsX RecA-like recombination protein [Aeromonas phage 65]|uniref:UvsX RecA-like recombination protein n=1 Tax=Aeromonas phage 65 TaxID=2919549 RepID=Q6RHT5_9CAUD|nr:DNA repair protein [Aeromonas phage 65]AAR90919.1 UvsX RecA-like recombination protein [Aeromonas phage 65]